MVENAGLSMELIDSWNLNPLEQLGNLAVFEHPGIIWECFLPPFCLMFPLFPTFSACYLSILQRQGWTKLGALSAPRNPTSTHVWHLPRAQEPRRGGLPERFM